jgi:hypothetical protein
VAPKRPGATHRSYTGSWVAAFEKNLRRASPWKAAGKACWQRDGYCRAIAVAPPRSTNFWILPVAVFGNASTGCQTFGALKWRTRSYQVYLFG